MISNGKLTKACVPCHKRKVRCDVPAGGFPCRRCVDRGCENDCVRAGRRQRPRHAGKPGQEATPDTGTQNVNQAVIFAVDQLSSGSSTSTSKPDNPLIVSSDNPSRQPDTSRFNSAEGTPVREDQVHVQICHEIASGNGLPPGRYMLDSFSPGRDFVEYHNGMQLMAILGELVGQHKTRRLTRIVIRDNTWHREPEQEEQRQSPGHIKSPRFSGLGVAEINFLAQKGALSVPPKAYWFYHPLTPYLLLEKLIMAWNSDELLKLYFEFCYPYTPVLNRVEFLQSYESGRFSPFLMQAILTNAAQYAPLQLLSACGFQDRLTAQKSFFSNAALLYDLGCERSQLRMLQGSLVLGTSIFSYTLDKDFRYWLQNAARIAINMGLHRNDIADDVDPGVYKLCRRLWWVLYSCDIVMSLTGLRNMRMLDSSDYDTNPLTEDDWDEGNISGHRMSLLSPISRQQKLYLIENIKLSKIGENCLSALKITSRPATENLDKDLAAQFALWRASLPIDMQIKPCPLNVGDNVLPIVLIAASYRLECILYRTLRKRHESKDQDRCVRANQRLKTAVLELDGLIARAMTDELLRMLPSSFMSCVFTVLALRIESAIHKPESDITRLMAYTYIRQSIVFLRQVRDLPIVEWSLTLFDWVLGQKGLLPIIDLPKSSLETSTSGESGNVSNSGADQSNDEIFLGYLNTPAAEFVNDPTTMFENILGFDLLDNFEISGL